MNKLQNFLLICKHWKAYTYWIKKKKNIKLKEYRLGAGYYVNTFAFAKSPIYKTLQMQSGKIGIFKLVEYEKYNDPPDMIQESWWDFMGYDNCPPIAECSFQEFLTLYFNQSST